MAPHPYLPHTQADIARMLDVCGAADVQDFYSDVPAELRLKEPYKLPDPMSEAELDRYFASLARMNRELVCFAGAGFYHHWTPAAIQAITSRSEFLTAYTPYQPEISQGTLQYIFEYQSMMCALTGMDVSNASMYDGATATAEAMVMAVNSTRKRRRILVSETVNPAICEVLATYASGLGIIIEMIPERDGVTSRANLDAQLGAGDVAGVIVAAHNKYGIIEDFEGFADSCHRNKALFIINNYASELGVLRSPAEWGADIACGEAQSLGMPLNYGGPYLGYLCCRKEFMRKLPGRIVGATTDSEGRRCFVLTLQAREQHIRRQKATSNICSNQGIMTLHAAMYLSLLGAQGLATVNRMSFEAAHSLAHDLCNTGKMQLLFPDKPFLNEFAVQLTDPLTADKLIEACAEKGILAGVKITDDTLLIAATEMCSPADIEHYVEIVKSL